MANDAQNTEKKPLHCFFCDKPRDEVEHLFEGPIAAIDLRISNTVSVTLKKITPEQQTSANTDRSNPGFTIKVCDLPINLCNECVDRLGKARAEGMLGGFTRIEDVFLNAASIFKRTDMPYPQARMALVPEAHQILAKVYEKEFRPEETDVLVTYGTNQLAVLNLILSGMRPDLVKQIVRPYIRPV